MGERISRLRRPERGIKVLMLQPRAIDPIITRALHEDLHSGDLTTEACVDAKVGARAQAVARQPLVVCGAMVFRRSFELVDPATRVRVCREDGTQVQAGEVLWQVQGRAQSVLMAERVALNFTQRMCGIASMARRYADAIVAGSHTRVCDTRKTTPGLRLLERYAVRTGGAHNHRDNLGSAVMIKDNHIIAAGGIAEAVARARARAPHTSRIEVEVGSLAELDEAQAAGADIIMLDNMDTATIVKAVARFATERAAGSGPILEASGGITLERIAELCEAGVDVISTGALTHSAPAADISLDFLPNEAPVEGRA